MKVTHHFVLSCEDILTMLKRNHSFLKSNSAITFEILKESESDSAYDKTWVPGEGWTLVTPTVKQILKKSHGNDHISILTKREQQLQECHFDYVRMGELKLDQTGDDEIVAIRIG